MKNRKFVDIKIRKEYRDMLKKYCRFSGDKMYIKIERLIEQNCTIKPTNTMKSKLVDD